MSISSVNTARRVFFVAMILVATPSCVSQSVFLSLTYPPNKLLAYTGADTIDTTIADTSECELAVRVSDGRLEKTQIGTISDGLIGEAWTPVLTEDNVAVWVHDAILFELTALGFTAATSSAMHDAQKPAALSVEIKEIKSSCYAVSCSATLQLAATLVSPRGETVVTSQQGKEGASGFKISYIPILEEALRRSLREAVQLTFHDLKLGNRCLSSAPVGSR